MKEKILELRKTGKSYKQISQLLGCSKSVVIYHCNDDQKEKQRKRQSDRRADAVIIKKVENFQKSVRNKSDDFQRERILVNGRPKLGKRNIKFHWQDVIKKFGWETTCYLTGEKINLKEPRKYHFDHIEPISKGGTSTLNNLGICRCDANQAKHDMSVVELIDLCKKILEHNGYKVEKPKDE
jgi:hypothetical protein